MTAMMGMMNGMPSAAGMRGGMPGMSMMPGMAGGSRASAEPTENEISSEVKKIAEEKLEWIEKQHKAYRYIVGVYQSSDYHMETLQKIYSYYLDAANGGDPIAQYHLALFIKYLGDIVDPYEYENADDCESAYQKWLEKARMSDLAKNRVQDLEKQVADAADKKTRRDAYKEKKLVALKTVEDDKLDMYDEILIRVRARISGSGGSGSGGTSSGGGGLGGGASLGGGSMPTLGGGGRR
jgi:hypothetical protein